MTCPRLAVLALIITACAPAAPRAAGRASQSFARLERTECLGSCPVYTLTIYADGTAQIDGRKLVASRTVRHAVTPAEAERLMSAVESIGAWSCSPDRIATDYPQAIISVVRPGKTRRIVYDHGDPCAPRAIRRLEAELDAAGGAPQLVPTLPEAE